MILYLVFDVGFQIANPHAYKTSILLGLWLLMIYMAAIPAILLKLIVWFVSNLEFSAGPPLSFTGTYPGLLGWNLLVMISCITIIGWAWASAGMYRWFARNTHGQGLEFRFHGEGHQILWRNFVFAMSCVLIIPIP